MAVALDGHPAIQAVACDTDGIDGTEDSAGAWLIPDTLARGRSLGLDAQAHLANNDGYSVFAALAALVVTGPHAPTSTVSVPFWCAEARELACRRAGQPVTARPVWVAHHSAN